MVNTILQQKMNIIEKNFMTPDKIFLNFENLVSVDIQSITIENQPKQKIPYLNGSVIARIHFAYINESDLFKQIEKFLDQRPSDKVKLISINK
ncbi:TPA: hypothetical protein DEP21_04555 [Patescibacteria group bacterium]|nr:hypothetical protein [Candidatus Gracilibacteria bacterium]